jgi:cytochrome P450
LLTSEGERWRRHRRLVQPLFSRREVRSFGPVMTAAAQRLLKNWEALPPRSVVDVAGQLSALALDIVGRALFSIDLAGDAPTVGRAMAAGQRVAVLATFLPLAWGPRSARALREVARRIGHSPEGIEGPVGRMIAQRHADLAAGSDQPRDLLQVLLTARDPDGSGLSDIEVSDELGTFMLAGHETSAVTLAWSLALLAAYPAARERLEQEVDDVLGGREQEAADADALPWTAAVIA